MSKNDNILVWRFVKQQCRNRKQRVEPSSCLVYRLGNKVCRELLFEQIFVLKRIVVLCKRHGTTVKPAVNHFRYTVHLFSTLWTSNRHIVDIWTVQFDIIRTVIRHLF